MPELAERLQARTGLTREAAGQVAIRLEQHPDLRIEVERWLDSGEFDRLLAAGDHTLGELVDRFGDTASAAVILMDLREQPAETQAFLDRGWDRVVTEPAKPVKSIPGDEIAAYIEGRRKNLRPESHLPIVGGTVLNEMRGYIIGGHTFDESPFAGREPFYREIWDDMERSIREWRARGVEVVPANDPD
jgi:hypothetical protein